MVFISLRDNNSNQSDSNCANLDALREYANHRGLLLGERAGDDVIRLVVHKHIGDDDIKTAAEIINAFCSQ